MNNDTKIPNFNSFREEAEFWDSHSIADYLDELKPAKVLVILEK
jgi:hypothetical protein